RPLTLVRPWGVFRHRRARPVSAHRTGADRATDFTTADLIDEHGDTLRSCATQFRGYGGRAFFAGPIRTVKCHEDNGLVKQVLNTPGEGAVLVVDGGGSLRSALMGDMIRSEEHTSEPQSRFDRVC